MEAIWWESVIMTPVKPNLFRRRSETILEDRSDGVSSPTISGTLRWLTITNGCAVTLKGEADSYTLAIWQDGTYSYSLSLSAGQPASVWESIVEGVA